MRVADLTPEQLERKRAYHREYNRLRRERVPGIDGAACRRWYGKNKEYNADRRRKWRSANVGRERDYAAQWRAENPGYHSEWRAANAARCRTYLANYRGRKAHATPAWADADEIAAVYAEAVRLTAATGIPHEVDHVIPLQGRNVCGLHVQTNLRVLTSAANRAKGNKFEEGQA